MILDHIIRNTPPYPNSQLPPYQPPFPLSSSPLSSPVNYRSAEAVLSSKEASGSGDGLLLRSGQSSEPPSPISNLDLGIPTLSDKFGALPVEHPMPGVAQSTRPPPRPEIPRTVPMSEPQVRSKLAEVMAWQNAHDDIFDLDDLRRMMRHALDTGDDAEMIRLLQVQPEEATEALKALRRAVEDEKAREQQARDQFASAQESDTAPSSLDASVGSLQGIYHGVSGSVDAAAESVEALGASLSRRPSTNESVLSRKSSASHASSSNRTRVSGSSHDTLDREFMESGIEALTRLSFQAGTPPAARSLPPWTITRFEVDLQRGVGRGFFSEVWQGRYRGRTVAVKILATWTPRELFLQEIHVWNELRHQYILEMVGASAVDATPETRRRSGWDRTRDPFPWFIVSRYYERGSLVKWVKGLPKTTWEAMLDDPAKGVLRMIHEITRGMAYLHGKGVLHGDLKVRLWKLRAL
jgi:abelson tyrosine-protein kinase 1